MSSNNSVASRALLAGESVDEVAFLLGHRDGTVTRTVYVREVADARRRIMRRSRMTAEFGGARVNPDVFVPGLVVAACVSCQSAVFQWWDPPLRGFGRGWELVEDPLDGTGQLLNGRTSTRAL